jgi:hypothetical protein
LLEFAPIRRANVDLTCGQDGSSGTSRHRVHQDHRFRASRERFQMRVN